MKDGLLTISEVSGGFGISTRMLRYYENENLLESQRIEGYAYRVYDEAAVLRLQQILILRKLRIPVRQIKLVLDNPVASAALEVFAQNIREIESEMHALDIIRDILTQLMEVLEREADVHLPSLLTGHASLTEALPLLTIATTNLKEGKLMSELNQAENTLGKLKDVRIVYHPPATVVSSRYVGVEPEDHAGKIMDDFIREIKLWEIYPQMRSYGFNSPNPTDDSGSYGYEFWVTIPEDLEVPAPLEKKTFPGGTFATHAIKMGDFQEWEWLDKWVMESGKTGDYEHDPSQSQGPANMFGSMEEHLNYIEHVQNGTGAAQLDLMIRVKKKDA